VQTLPESDEKEVNIKGTSDQLAMAVTILCNQLADIPEACVQPSVFPSPSPPLRLTLRVTAGVIGRTGVTCHCPVAAHTNRL
jgi:hypothetical protein